MELIFEYPTWTLWLCGLGASILAFWLYRKDRLTRHLSLGLRIFLGLLRFSVLFLLAVLLLKPLIRSTEQQLERPLIIFAQDNSESLRLSKDSTYLKTEYKRSIQSLLSELEEDYDLQAYTFGSSLNEGLDSLNFNEKQTDISDMLDALYNRYSNRNIGAIILATDGIYNKGSSPIYEQKRLNVPIYTIALGDTTEQRDVRIVEVANNNLAYLGNQFPIEIVAEAKQCKSETIRVEIKKGEQVLFSESFIVDSDFEQKQFTALLTADKTGLQRYRVHVTKVQDEVTYLNNQQDVFIDVLDSKQRILILASSPHPDIAAIEEAISSNKNYEVETAIAKTFAGEVEDFDLVVFHQLPAGTTVENKHVQNALDNGVSTFFILGSGTNFNVFNGLKLGFALKNYKGALTDVSGRYADGFNQFQVDDVTKKMFRSLPPVQMPFGNLELSPGASVILYQQIGMIETENGLLATNTVRGSKTAVFAGEGIWRWRMVQYLKDENHQKFDGFIQKLVQYLASRENKNQFQVHGPSNLLETEPVLFEAQVYDANFEAIPDQNIGLIIKSAEGKEFPYSFSQVNGRYRLNAGQLSAGNYSWEATSSASGKQLLTKGEFSISPLQIESAKISADHQLLFNLAEQSNGKMLYPSQISEITKLINANNEVVTVSYEFNKLTDFIEIKWLLFLLLILLGTEWFVRKRSGTY